MFIPSKQMIPVWALCVLAGSFLLAALLVVLPEPQTSQSGDLFSPAHLLAILLYTLVFAGPILLIGGIVSWLQKA